MGTCFRLYFPYFSQVMGIKHIAGIAFLLLAGLSVSWSLCVLLANRQTKPSTSVDSGSIPSRQSVSLPGGPTLPERVRTIKSVGNSPAHFLDFARAAAQSTPAECQEAALKAMDLPEPARSSLLKLLLLQWARQEPGKAADWVLGNLSGTDRALCIRDLITDWVHLDSSQFAAWYQALEPKTKSGLYNSVERTLLQESPGTYGKWWESPALRNLATTNAQLVFDSIRDVAAVTQCLAAAGPHVDYPNEDSTAATDRWNTNGRIGWNNLFEAAAACWYSLDAPACEAWLKTRTEFEQRAAWALIKELGPAANYEPTRMPPASGESAPAGFSRTDLISQPSPESAPDFRREWAAWWTTEPETDKP